MPGELDERRHVLHRRVVLQGGGASPTAQVVDGQPQARMALGDTADVRQRIRRQHRDRHAGPLGGGPQPIERPVSQPAPQRLLEKSIAQTQHARLAPPLLDQGALVRLIQGEGTEDREAAGKVSYGLEGHLGRVGIPARRVDHRGVDTALVHEAHGLLGGERSDLTMGHVAGQTAAPEMDLGIHDAHRASLPSIGNESILSGPMPPEKESPWSAAERSCHWSRLV